MNTQRKVSAGRGHPVSSKSISSTSPSEPAAAVGFNTVQFNNTDAAAINTITIKLPQLWTSHVRGWFAQAEDQFVTKGVTASFTKYFYALQPLPEQTIGQVPALLTLSAVENQVQVGRDV